MDLPMGQKPQASESLVVFKFLAPHRFDSLQNDTQTKPQYPKTFTGKSNDNFWKDYFDHRQVPHIM